MTQEQWVALVRRLEPQARENPRAYQRKVAFLGALAYGFIGLSLVVLAVLAVLVIAGALAGPALLLKLLIPIGALGWLIVRSLSVRLDPPEGIALNREDAPELFRMIDEVDESVRGPKINRVLIDAEPNASIVQIPRRGVIFGSRNYLVLGLPYLQALTPDEFRAVVAHELGHLSRSHGRFGAWIYRIQATWWQLLASLEAKRHWTTGIFRRFFEWYVPRFDAYSFPLRRAHEFEADESAAAAAGPQAAMTALLSGTVTGRYLYEDYWPKIFTRVNDEPEPPRSAFAPMARELVGAREGADVRTLLEAEIRREPDAADTHPSLAERIEHLGLDAQELIASVSGSRPERTAAQEFLGPAETELAERLDREWHEAVAPEWRARHREQQEARAELERLDERSRTEQLGIEDARRHAELTEEFRGGDGALERYRAVLAIDPNDALANFAVGRLLLERDDESGLPHLDRAMDADHEAVLPACELAIAYLEKHGRDDDARRYRERGEGQLEVYDAAVEERSEVSVDDDLLPPALEPEQIEVVRSVLERHDEVAQGYLVRKRVEHLADDLPLYVLALIPAKRWRQLWKDSDDDREEGTLEQRVAADLTLPVDFHVVVPGPRSGMDERLEAVPGARIFSRD